MLFSKRKRRQAEQREGRKNGWAFASRGTYKLGAKWGHAGAFCAFASPWSRAQPSASQPPRGSSSLWHSLAQWFWHCPLWPLDKNVHLHIPSYPKSICCVLGIKNKCGTLPCPVTTLSLRLWLAFTSIWGKAQTCLKRIVWEAELSPQPVAPLPPDLTQWQGESADSPNKQWGRGTAGSPRVCSLEISRTLFGSLLGRDRAKGNFKMILQKEDSWGWARSSNSCWSHTELQKRWD